MTYRCYVGESLRAFTRTDVRLPDLLEPGGEPPLASQDSRTTAEVAESIIDGLEAILGEEAPKGVEA